VNEKSDVFSFGVVLLELVTGRQPIAGEFGDAMTIVTWVTKKIREHGENFVIELLDKRISNLHFHQNQMITMFKIANSCTQHLPNERPTMRRVVEMLLDVQKIENTTF
jgi:serine/threonine protein kinase